MMDIEDKLDNLAKNIIMLQGRTEQLQRYSEAVAEQAVQAIDQAGSVLDGTAAGIQKTADRAITFGMEKPLGELERKIQDACKDLVYTCNHVEKQQRETVKKLKWVLWLMVGALCVSTVVSAGSVFALTKYSHQEITRSDWIGDINQAIAKGTLSRCENGKGVCSKVGGKWVRLDN